MRKLPIILMLTAATAFLSCNKVERTCDNLDLDFVYSIGYPTDSSYAHVSFTKTSNAKKYEQTTNWYINGASYIDKSEKMGDARFNNNGHFSITMVVEEDGIECNVVKEFDITGIKDTLQ